MAFEKNSDPEFWELFSRHIAHQLNNPLAAIGSSAYILTELVNEAGTEPVNAESLSPFVLAISEETGKLREMVAEFREFFRARSPLLATIDLSEFIEHRSREAEAFGIRVETKIAVVEKDFRASLDAGMLQKALHLIWQGLAGYGVKDGSLELRLETEVWVVELGGMPITEAHFLGGAGDPFEVSNASAAGALGLGLPLARKLIELQGGSVIATRWDQSNLRVEIQLPRRLGQYL